MSGVLKKKPAHAVGKGRRNTLSDVDASQAHEIATLVDAIERFGIIK
jgi:hypothetical protein